MRRIRASAAWRRQRAFPITTSRESGMRTGAASGRDFQALARCDFAAKVEDVVGLYLNPPDKALVLCVDEKSQIQALDRAQPGLPMKKGHAGTMTHDHKRNGTTTLFAALNMLDGQVVGTCMPRHQHREFLRFQADRSENPGASRPASDRRQLCHS